MRKFETKLQATPSPKHSSWQLASSQEAPLQPDPATAAAPHRVFNIGNSQPTELIRFIEVMEEALGREAIKDFQPIQPGDVVETAADTQALQEWVGFKPSTTIEVGIECFARWYRDFYKKQ